MTAPRSTGSGEVDLTLGEATVLRDVLHLYAAGPIPDRAAEVAGWLAGVLRDRAAGAPATTASEERARSAARTLVETGMRRGRIGVPSSPAVLTSPYPVHLDEPTTRLAVHVLTDLHAGRGAGRDTDYPRETHHAAMAVRVTVKLQLAPLLLAEGRLAAARHAAVARVRSLRDGWAAVRGQEELGRYAARPTRGPGPDGTPRR
jgi:hypothetical protein